MLSLVIGLLVVSVIINIFLAGNSAFNAALYEGELRSKRRLLVAFDKLRETTTGVFAEDAVGGNGVLRWCDLADNEDDRVLQFYDEMFADPDWRNTDLIDDEVEFSRIVDAA